KPPLQQLLRLGPPVAVDENRGKQPDCVIVLHPGPENFAEKCFCIVQPGVTNKQSGPLIVPGLAAALRFWETTDGIESGPGAPVEVIQIEGAQERLPGSMHQSKC